MKQTQKKDERGKPPAEDLIKRNDLNRDQTLSTIYLPLTNLFTTRKQRKALTTKRITPKQITNFHFHKIIVRQIKRKNVRTSHKRKEKSVAVKSQQSLHSQTQQSRKLRKDFHKHFVKTKETETEAERPSTGPRRESQTTTGNILSRDRKKHIFTVTIEEVQEKRKTDLEDVKVTF